MLKQIFTSNARIKILALFLANPEEEYYIRQLTRELDEQINSIRRELNNLKKIGLLTASLRNRKKYYKINSQFLLLPELTSIFNKVNNDKSELLAKIDKLGTVKLLILSGIFINKEKQIDLLLVGQINKDELGRLLENELNTKEPVKFSVLDTEDFLYRHKFNDRFITSIIKERENIVAINRLTDQIKLDF